MGKKNVQYDHSWRIAPQIGRNWTSKDYIKYTTTYKPKDGSSVFDSFLDIFTFFKLILCAIIVGCVYYLLIWLGI
jgi:hypothetical protein